MRVISQDGRLDFPYEESVIFINPVDASEVRMVAIGDDDDGMIAEYSTEEKAKKAMEMLREAWINEAVEFEDGICHRNIIFQFPTEEELE